MFLLLTIQCHGEPTAKKSFLVLTNDSRHFQFHPTKIAHLQKTSSSATVLAAKTSPHGRLALNTDLLGCTSYLYLQRHQDAKNTNPRDQTLASKQMEQIGPDPTAYS